MKDNKSRNDFIITRLQRGIGLIIIFFETFSGRDGALSLWGEKRETFTSRFTEQKKTHCVCSMYSVQHACILDAKIIKCHAKFRICFLFIAHNSKLCLFFSKLYTQIQELYTKCKTTHISCKMKHCVQNITYKYISETVWQVKILCISSWKTPPKKL